MVIVFPCMAIHGCDGKAIAIDGLQWSLSTGGSFDNLGYVGYLGKMLPINWISFWEKVVRVFPLAIPWEKHFHNARCNKNVKNLVSREKKLIYTIFDEIVSEGPLSGNGYF